MAGERTMVFIGVTTGESSINRVFPKWASVLGVTHAQLVGWDFPIDARPDDFREAIDRLKRDSSLEGALVTTHKLSLFKACQDQFDYIDPLAKEMEEIGSIYKRDGRLCGRAVDPQNSGRALAAFLPGDHWLSGAEVLILGAGGAGVALAWHLCVELGAEVRPSKLTVTDVASIRLEHVETFLKKTGTDLPVRFLHTTGTGRNDDAISELPDSSLVVNATGLGKDAPGSPLSNDVAFPKNGLVWDFNYRGNLVFLEQAHRQAVERNLQVVDGWTYFLHGWTSVISDVFDIVVPTKGEIFDELSRTASDSR